MEPGTHRAIVALAIAVREQGLRQPFPAGTRLRNRRTGVEAVCVGCKPSGFKDRPFGGRSADDAAPGAVVRGTALVWTLTEGTVVPRHSQSPLADWAVARRESRTAA